MSERSRWMDELPGSIVVCDPQGVIVEMNQRATESFREQGGAALLGTDLRNCHPEPSRTKLEQLLESRRPNIYSIEKGGVHKLVYQSPWYVHGEYAGFVELVLEIPAPMPHFVRDA